MKKQKYVVVEAIGLLTDAGNQQRYIDKRLYTNIDNLDLLKEVNKIISTASNILKPGTELTIRCGVLCSRKSVAEPGLPKKITSVTVMLPVVDSKELAKLAECLIN